MILPLMSDTPERRELFRTLVTDIMIKELRTECTERKSSIRAIRAAKCLVKSVVHAMTVDDDETARFVAQAVDALISVLRPSDSNDDVYLCVANFLRQLKCGAMKTWLKCDALTSWSRDWVDRLVDDARAHFRSSLETRSLLIKGGGSAFADGVDLIWTAEHPPEEERLVEAIRDPRCSSTSLTKLRKRLEDMVKEQATLDVLIGAIDQAYPCRVADENDRNAAKEAAQPAKDFLAKRPLADANGDTQVRSVDDAPPSKRVKGKPPPPDADVIVIDN